MSSPSRAAAVAGYRLFTPLVIDESLVLKNRVVMAPLTRARADKTTHVPKEANQLYYAQRAGAGLIVTEATAISEQGFGWYGAAALYNQAHVDGWKKVVDAVHARDGKIFLQLWHMGRQGHPSFNPRHEVVSASAIGLTQGRVRDANGDHAPYAVPRALETDEIPGVVEMYRRSAALAKQAGFDGVEIHGANGYLIDQFLQSATNHRTDAYGGSIENRARFLLEVVDAVQREWPASRVGVRLSPNNGRAGMGSADNYEQFVHAIEQLAGKGLAYLAILDGEGFGFHDKGRLVTAFEAKRALRGGRVLANNSYSRDVAEGAVRSGAADLVSFGRPYIANPDLAERFQHDWPLNAPAPHEVWWDANLGAEGYTTFPAYAGAP